MGIAELILTSVGLAMDAFAAAVCKGLSMKKFNIKYAVIIALFFGLFQGLMPLCGWALGIGFSDYITAFDHWIAFVLLAFIGGKMLKDSREESCEISAKTNVLDIKELVVLSFATSIDAMAVGVSLAFLPGKISIVSSVSVIAVITFVISFLGTLIGNRFGCKYKSKAEFAGGAILVIMGIKILIEHLTA